MVTGPIPAMMTAVLVVAGGHVTTDLRPLSSLKPRSRCPDCFSVHLECSSREQNQVSRNGATLWTLSQRCSMCPWETTTSDVKMGA